MVHGGEHHGLGVQPRPAGSAFVQTGGGGGQAENFQHRTALGPFVEAVAAGNVVRRNASLFVGRPRQGDKGGLPGDEVVHLHRVTHGINVRVGGLHPVIDQNAAFQAQFQPRVGGQSAVRRHADGQNHHVGLQRLLAFEQHLHTAVGFGKAFHRVAQGQAHAVGPDFPMDQRRHIGVKRSHQLLGALYDGDFQPAVSQVLGQLQANKAAARQHHRPGMLLLHKTVDAQSVLHRAQGEQPVQPHAGQRGLGGFGAGGQQQFVVGFGEHFAGIQIAYRDGFGGAVDGGHLVADLHLYPEPLIKALRGLQRQFGLVLDHAADVVGQTAVGVGYIPRTLKHHDLGGFIQPAQPGCRGGAARHSAYDDHFHLIVPPFRDSS